MRDMYRLTAGDAVEGLALDGAFAQPHRCDHGCPVELHIDNSRGQHMLIKNARSDALRGFSIHRSVQPWCSGMQLRLTG
jgi:hypothetical protein